MRKHLRAGLLGAVLAAVSPCTQGIQAGTIIVTSTDDSGPGSLREALALAETGDRIVFDASTAARPILLTSGQLILDTDVTIEGLGSSMTIVDGNASSRVFLVGNNVTATISNLTIRNGFEAHLTAEKLAVGEGGGIYNQGYLTVGNSVITHNTVSSLHQRRRCL